MTAGDYLNEFGISGGLVSAGTAIIGIGGYAAGIAMDNPIIGLTGLSFYFAGQVVAIPNGLSIIISMPMKQEYDDQPRVRRAGAGVSLLAIFSLAAAIDIYGMDVMHAVPDHVRENQIRMQTDPNPSNAVFRG